MRQTHAEGRHPVELGVLGACVGCGVLHLSTNWQPTVIHQALGSVVGGIWAGVLAAGSLVALLGVFWRGSLETGLNLEMVGLSVASGMLLATLPPILWATPVTGSIAAPLVLGLGGGLAGRLLDIFLMVRRAHRQARQLMERIL